MPGKPTMYFAIAMIGEPGSEIIHQHLDFQFVSQ